MGLVGAIWSSETSLIGSGWLFGSLFAAQAVGTAALLSWAIAGVIVIVLALVHAELGGMYPVSGGTARFPHFAFGSVAGASFGFFSWLQAVCVAPIECFAVMQYGQYWFTGHNINIYNPTTKVTTGLGFVFTIILMAIFTAINFLAMRLFNRVNSVITVWKVAIPLLAIIVLFTQFKSKNFGAGGGFMPYGLQSVFSAMPTAGIVFAYLGFEQADQLAGEIKNPQKNLPRAIIIAIALAIVIGLMYQTSTSRVGYGLARNRYFPTAFRWTDKNGVPWFSLLAAFALGLLFLLPFPSWKSLVGLVTSASVLMYAGAPLALSAFRKQVPDAPRPYRMPGAVWLAPLAFIFACEIIYFSGFDTVWKLGICVVAGYIIIGAWMAYDKERPPLDWKSAQWLPVFLIGMGIISWQGRYCSSGAAKAVGASCSATNRIPFWWDMGIVAVFALLIFFWAQAVRLPRQEMMNLVERQAGGEEEAKALGEVNPA
jgi:amino acid transporter